jgi:nucleoside-diphosphate-sugar epimerase
VCNIGTGKETSVNVLLAEMARQAGVEVEPEFQPLRAGELARNCLDPTRAGIQLGWNSWTELGSGTLATIEFVRERLQESGEL